MATTIQHPKNFIKHETQCFDDNDEKKKTDIANNLKIKFDAVIFLRKVMHENKSLPAARFSNSDRNIVTIQPSP